MQNYLALTWSTNKKEKGAYSSTNYRMFTFNASKSTVQTLMEAKY